MYRYLIRRSTFEIKLIAFSGFFLRKLGAFVENSHSASGAKFNGSPSSLIIPVKLHNVTVYFRSKCG